MCRWIAYIGKPIFIDTLVTKPEYSLVEQSLNSKRSFKSDGSILSTNGDGFGVAWYMHKEEPGLFKTAEPAWANENINEICSQIHARIFMAHIRAASTGTIQRTNAHPFKYKNWIFQHNGYLKHFDVLRRDLQFDIAPEYYNTLKGTTDSETLFLLMLTFGLEKDPKKAIEELIKYLRKLYHKKEVEFDLMMSCAFSDGSKLYTLRYSSGKMIHSQYYSTHKDSMKEIDESSDSIARNSVVVVSEPLDQYMDRWQEMPIGSFSTIHDGKIEIKELDID